MLTCENIVLSYITNTRKWQLSEMRKEPACSADQKTCQTLEAWFEVVRVSSFRVCWFIHVCFAPGPRLQGKRGHCQPFLPSWAPHKPQKHAHAGELTVMRPSRRISPDARHRDQRLALVIAAWLMTVVTQKNNSGDEAHRGKGHVRTCVWFFSAHKLYVSLLPICVCPRHRGLQKLTSPSSSHDKYERFENPDQGVTNRITCCLHLVVIIRALMTGEELIEMKITPRRVWCARGSAWMLNGCLEW